MSEHKVVTREERVGDLLGHVYDALVLARMVHADEATIKHLRAAAERLEERAVEGSGSPAIHH
ncbi:hypothetical protein [Aureimonas populi]|uniref:DUF2783 domain-containing protein n=1 Tax=Aureimonas populi TaxID=1701758 RepID=A0ABW5CH15_9HYPH|nr:hypothetical protein [Aureimonas populi]